VLLIPAIDLKEGQCVRLRQGRMDDSTVFSEDPVAMAVHWAELGCRRLHIVDLDGAFAGQPKNRSLIQAMVQSIAQVPVQVGGGIRSIEVIESYLEAGVQSVIVGTKAIEDPQFLQTVAEAFPQQVFLGLDARGGKVATQGWDETSSLTAVELACNAATLPIAGIVYTDIDRDGMMSGLNVEATVELAKASGVPVVASGGVTTIDDLAQLKAGFADCADLLYGAITGRAIYEGRLDVAAGQQLLDE
jgi:phosphoribosylformimino-5-aminoimidazole carboxamide ribotide isomerase